MRSPCRSIVTTAQPSLRRTTCRRKGVPVGAIDALLAQLCIRHEPTMLTTDEDFTRIAAQYPLRLWTA